MPNHVFLMRTSHNFLYNITKHMKKQQYYFVPGYRVVLCVLASNFLNPDQTVNDAVHDL